MVNVNSDKEWIRRRKMRLMQVRKQSDEIAKMLRERVIDEEIQKKIAEEQEMELNFQLWKFRRLNELEEMYRKAIKDFGIGHEMASKEPVSEKLERQKEYLCKAKRRGENALQQELKIKEEANEKKTIPIQRKLITRKIEDLRSMLVRSIDVKNPPIFLRNVCIEKVFDPRSFENREENEESDIEELSHQEGKTGAKKDFHPVKVSIENQASRKKFSQKKEKGKKKIFGKNHKKPDFKCEVQKKVGAVKEGTSKLNRPKSEKLWIDLGVAEVLTDNEELENKEEKPISLEIEKNGGKEKIMTSKEKPPKKEKNIDPKKEDSVECCGYSFHHRCNLKENTALVQRMDDSKMDAIELAKREEEELTLRTNEEKNRKMVAKERGSKAVLKEKVNRSFTELLTKLEKLSTKEKLIKTYCHLPPSHVFFSDDRRREKLSKKQQKMDSEFERIFYEVKGVNPNFHSEPPFNLDVCAKDSEPDKDFGNLVTKLDFSQFKSNLKANTRPSSCCQRKGKELSNSGCKPTEEVKIKKTPSSFRYKRTKIIKGGNKTISDIDKILKKSRKLRQESIHNMGLPLRECKSNNDFSDRKPVPEEESNSQVCEMSLGSLASGSIALELNKLDSLSPSEGDRVSDILKDLKKSFTPKSSDASKSNLEDLGMGDLGNNFPRAMTNITAWPVHRINQTKDFDDYCGSSENYVSVPKKVCPEKFCGLIGYLDELRRRKGNTGMADEQLKMLEDLLCSVMGELEVSYASSCEEDSWTSEDNNNLSNYISKLLDMSREKVSKLFNSSSEFESSPEHLGSFECCKTQTRLPNESKYAADNCKSPEQTKAKDLDGIITEWKSVLEQVIENSPKSNKPNQYENDKAHVKCMKKTSEGQNKSRVQCTPRSATRPNEFPTQNICPEREATGGESNKCKTEMTRSRDSEHKCSPRSGSKGHKSRDSSVKSHPKSNGASFITPESNIFICDERTCPYLNPDMVNKYGYPDMMQYLTDNMYNVNGCKFGCPSPCPGHTEVLKRRPLYYPSQQFRDESESGSGSTSIPPRFWANMNYYDAAQGIFSPLPSAVKIENVKELEQQSPIEYVPPNLDDSSERKLLNRSGSPDWNEYEAFAECDPRIPFANTTRQLCTGQRPFSGRIWQREAGSNLKSNIEKSNIEKSNEEKCTVLDDTWSDTSLSDSECEASPKSRKELKRLKEEKKLAAKERQERIDCHDFSFECDSECKKDYQSVTFKRIYREWLAELQPKPGTVEDKARKCCYQSCMVHCRKRNSSDSSDSSCYENDGPADDTCCNACPAHCDVNKSYDGCEALTKFSSDDRRELAEREKFKSYMKL